MGERDPRRSLASLSHPRAGSRVARGSRTLRAPHDAAPRHEAATALAPLSDLPAAALRHMLRSGYSLADLRADLLAACVVGVVALPLSMALAIACGVPPQYGLYTAIVAGGSIAPALKARASCSRRIASASGALCAAA